MLHALVGQTGLHECRPQPKEKVCRMTKPTLLAVDDDPLVLRAVERDLRKEYGSSYRVLRADSGEAALEALKQLKLRNEPVALFLVDQRMPRMSGVEFLERAIGHFPEAKRVLLTAYADTDAAINAINKARIDYYLMKPWDPPEERLYPLLNDLLEDWQGAFRPPFEGIRVVGHRWSPMAHEIKDFLARNHAPYRWLDVETEDEAQKLVQQTGTEANQLPLVVFQDGIHMTQPSTLQIAEKIGLTTRAKMPFYDLIVIGGGPAALAAAVYGASEGLRTVMIEKQAPGGQAGTTSRIENYLGFPSGLSGADLARRAETQARRFGVEILTPQEVVGIRVNDTLRDVTLSDKSELSCHALLIATGVSYRTLDVPGCAQLTGAGVYYGAAMIEALSYRDQNVIMVGGGNSAGQAAVYFSQHSARVTLIVRGDSLAKTMSKYLVDRIETTNNIVVRLRTEVTEVRGTEHLEAVTLMNRDTGAQETLPAHALFVFIGAKPHTDWCASIIERDEHGFILTGPDLMRDGKPPRGWRGERQPMLLETNVPGIFVAGDVRHGSVKRVASAVGEGAIAVQLVHRYLSGF